jgi:ParB-like chromosome segregation protein Spo0J
MHPERRVTLDSIRFGDVLSHPLSEKVYGKPKPTAALLSSIEKAGILQALIVNETTDGKFELLVGNTRREAWRLLYEQKRVKTQWIPCKFVQLSPMEAEQMVLESNLQRVKTKEQEAREYKEKLRIEKWLAKYRQSLQVNLPEGSKGQARDLAAKGLSMSGSTAERLLTVVEAADHGDKTARAALKEVNAGGSIDAAYKAVKPPKNTEEIAAQNKAAHTYTVQFKAKGITAEVSRAKDGKFHVMLKNQTTKQVEELLQ